MGKKLFIGLLGLLPLFALGQSNVAGRFSLSTGFDWGVHGVEAALKYNTGTTTTTVSQDTTGALTKQFTFNAHYGIAKWFSAGLGFKTGSYLEDPKDNVDQSNSVGHFYLDTRFYPLNKDKFNLFVGLSFGRSNLHIDRSENFGLFAINQKTDFRSGYSRFQLGFNWYFANKVGFWFNTEFNRHLFKAYYHEINGTEFDLSNYDYTLRTIGFQVQLGVCIKFR